MFDASGEFYVISDCHLVPGSEVCQHFIEFMDVADDRGIPVVLAGDVIEGFVANHMWKFLNKTDAPVFNHVVSFAFHDRMIVRGNHDNDVSYIRDAPDVMVHNRTAIAHGHHFDSTCSGAGERISDFFGRLTNRLTWRGHKSLARVARNFRDVFFNDRAFRWMRRNEVETMICGHTHHPGVFESSDDLTLAVCGAWVDGPPYKYVHYNKRFVSVEEYTPIRLS